MFFNDIFSNIALLIGAFALSFALFPFSVRLSQRIGAIDLPNERKLHSFPMARTGGVSFFVSFSVFLSLAGVSRELKLCIVTGGSVIFLVGLLDDARTLSPIQKLTGQLAAAAFPLFFGIAKIDASPEQAFLIGAFSLFWILLITNAVNLSDGLDALAAGSASSFALSLALLSLLSANGSVLLASLVLLSALAGFLPRNAPPAKIFMGDCGSLFIGYVLAVLSLYWLLDEPSAPRLILLPIIFAVPLSDTIQSFLRRIRSGKSPFAADKGHFHHKLLRLGFTKETAALALIACSLIFELCAVMLMISFLK